MKSLAIVVLSVLAICAGCASYGDKMKTWVGQPVEVFIERNGYPEQVTDLPNGKKAYLWIWHGDTRIRGPRIITNMCKTWVEADADDIIVKLRWEGNCN